MAEMSETSDMGKGLVLVFGIITALAAIGTAASAYQSEIAGGDDSLQILSGVFLAVAFVAAGIAVAAVHVYR
jgi:hypothetical protein